MNLLEIFEIAEMVSTKIRTLALQYYEDFQISERLHQQNFIDEFRKD